MTNAQPAGQPVQAGHTEPQTTLHAVSSDPANRAAEMERLTTAVKHHEDSAKRHADAAKAAKHALMLLHGQRGATVELEDGTKITWKTPARSFQAAEFQAAYPPEANAYLYETRQVLDVSAIPPKLKNNFMREGSGDGSIIIK